MPWEDMARKVLEMKSKEFKSKALAWAVNEGQPAFVAEILSCRDIDANTPDVNGWLPLCYAARQGHADVTQVLIEQGGADVNMGNRDPKKIHLCPAGVKLNSGMCAKTIFFGSVVFFVTVAIGIGHSYFHCSKCYPCTK